MSAPLALPLYEWRHDDPGHRGTFDVMIRLPGDPERRPRVKGEGGKNSGEARALKRSNDVTALVDAVEALLHGDHRPRTLNAIGVALLDKTADITAGTALEEALWLCVRERSVRWALHPSGALVFTSWPEGEPLHPSCSRCMEAAS